MRVWRLATIAACLLTSSAIPARAAEPRIVFDQVASKWIVAPNGTWVVDADVTIRAPKDNPTRVVRVPLTWSGSIETLEIVQARNDKPDGRSVVLEQSAIREDPPVGDVYFHEFSDERRLIITFANAEPGDLLVIRARRVMLRPRVPGGFMVAPVLDRSVGWEDTNYTISIPRDMPIRVETRGFDDQAELIKDRMFHYLHAPKVVAPAKEVAILGAFDRLPRFAVSTFRDWDEFGKAYASVFLPHAQVTPGVAAMAATITEGVTNKREQARLLFEWVRDHIRYIPIPLEESRPIPNDAERVMTKLYGDDKDHVVLMYALLAARGIPAEIVLLNASDSATISDAPNLRPMNHLIVFMPGLDVYADSTLRVAPFGFLPFPQIGKPAIHLGAKPGMARRTIPVPSSGDTRAEMTTEMVLGADGKLTGTTTTTASGAFGVWLRNTALSFGQDNASAATIVLRQHGTPGSGSFSFDPPTSGGASYTVRGTFELSSQRALLQGGFFALWTGLRVLPRPGDILGGPLFARDLAKNQPTFCYPGVQTETLSLTLPEGSALGSLPNDTTIDTELIRYRSHWAMNGQRVTVTREYQSLVPGPVCDRSLREDLADVLKKIRADMVSPVGIRQDKMPERIILFPDETPKQRAD
jgi:transglutaminase-like putative cysteine protease